jgi:hypothetical protein
MPISPDKAWFRRRRFGIGWALHKSWQGWLLVIAYLFIAAAGLAQFEKRPVALSIYLVFVTACALLLCWWKGENHSGEEMRLPSKERPNQSPEPMVMSVTPRADARVAPATTMAHL